MIPWLAKYMATVRPLLSYKLGSCYQHYSGIYLQEYAIYIAVVILPLFANVELWYHSHGGIMPLAANIIATVFPFLFYTSESCIHSYGDIILLYARLIATV